MKRSNFALRLQPSLMEELRKTAAMEGVPLNQFINVAVAEKLATLRTEDFFRERAKRANRADILRILDRADNPPMPGDELPPDLQPSKQRVRSSRQKSRSTK